MQYIFYFGKIIKLSLVIFFITVNTLYLEHNLKYLFIAHITIKRILSHNKLYCFFLITFNNN